MAAPSQNQIGGDGSQGPPPTYDETVGNTTRQNNTTTQIQPMPGPAGNGRFYHNEPGPPSIMFIFTPEPGTVRPGQQWVGQMNIKCRDVPLLMREGFHWTMANVIREEGFMELSRLRGMPDGLPGRPNMGGAVTRNWFLRDLQQPSRWTACIQVHSPTLGTASTFELENLTLDLIKVVIAWGLSRRLVYYFNKLRPEMNFNTIYDGMPLEGRWPWPKREQQPATEGT
ncbi:hypothetical protein F5B20DRAFT_584799 [Whalleya microplaca]|nr:hypothetical protein F5B20DRAFT_584799 [Whalleya microplaca]